MDWKFSFPNICEYQSCCYKFYSAKEKNINNESLFSFFENGLYLYQHSALPE